jgi:hypothetical protein
MSNTLHQASQQWASRPDDQRFTSLTDLHQHCDSQRTRSVGKVVSSRQIEAIPVDGDHRGLRVIGPNGGPVDVTNYSFGQLSQRAGAPAGYLRALPSPLAADCINYGLKFNRDAEEIGVLLTKPMGGDGASLAEMRACTGPNYGRVWNADITKNLVDKFGDGITGDFRVPGEFGKAVDVTKANTTLYASDRDMFVFLADEKNRITLPNRRNGESGSLARGFFVWNSEVGAATCGIGLFLFDYVCCNRIVWGAEGYKELRIRHTAAAPDRWIEEVSPAIQAYAESSTKSIDLVLAASQEKKVDDIDAFLKGRRFTASQVSGIKTAYLADEQHPLEDGASLWDVTTAVTAFARGKTHQDERVTLEREGGNILQLAA